MEPTETEITTENTAPIAPLAGSIRQAVVEELLIEEISIDGMCGVY